MTAKTQEQVLSLEMHDFLSEMCYYRFRYGPKYYFVQLKLNDVTGFYEANAVSNAVKYVVGYIKPELLDNTYEMASLQVAVQDMVKRWRYIEGTRHAAAQKANDGLDVLTQEEWG